MDAAIGAIAQDSPVNRDSRDVIGAQRLHQRLIKWLAAPSVMFADQYSHHLGLRLQLGGRHFGRWLFSWRRRSNDGCIVNFNQSMACDFRQLRQDFLYSLCCLNEFDLDWHLVGEVDEAAGVQLMIGPKARNSAGNGGIGDPAKEQVIENCGVTSG